KMLLLSPKFLERAVSSSLQDAGVGRGPRRGISNVLHLLRPMHSLVSARRCQNCSADFQSAVSPNSNRQNVGAVPRCGIFHRLAECNSAIRQSTTLRYGEALDICPRPAAESLESSHDQA